MSEPLPPDWRTLGQVEPERPGSRPADGPGERPSGSDGQRFVLLLGLLVLAAGVLGVAAVVVIASRADPGAVVIDASHTEEGTALPGQGLLLGDPPSPPSASSGIVVDVEGAVQRPGLHRLDPGARLGDAIAAAGGFSVRVDAEAAGRTLNLAEPLTDGSKIHVPSLGETAMPGVTDADGAPGGTDDGGPLIDLNSADQALLETLPQIGPVTASAIIAAREEAPFTSVDDLRSREVVGPSTFEQIRALVTVGG
ncbi:MAG: helix-hairpin-helix domain-containing protein [Candidatus Limnocylindrales bacterium]